MSADNVLKFKMSSQSNTSFGVQVKRATEDDIPAICAMVNAAYTKYVERIGRKPAPMTADYGQLLTTHEMYVLHDFSQGAEKDTRVGSIVLEVSGESLHVNNLVVSPTAQGRGYGRLLMNFADEVARKRDVKRLKLYTNVKMWENIGLYARLGFDEVGRRVEDGFERVYFEKVVT